MPCRAREYRGLGCHSLASWLAPKMSIGPVTLMSFLIAFFLFQFLALSLVAGDSDAPSPDGGCCEVHAAVDVAPEMVPALDTDDHVSTRAEWQALDTIRTRAAAGCESPARRMAGTPLLPAVFFWARWMSPTAADGSHIRASTMERCSGSSTHSMAAALVAASRLDSSRSYRPTLPRVGASTGRAISSRAARGQCAHHWQ
jgi:hypothetical protein